MISIDFIYSPTDSQLDDDDDIVVQHHVNPTKTTKLLTEVIEKSDNDMNKEKNNKFYLSSLKTPVSDNFEIN